MLIYLMEESINRKNRFLSYKNSLILLECILFFTIITFFVLIFITHPPGAATCDVVSPKLWVTIFFYCYCGIVSVPQHIYDFINRKKELYPEVHNLVRILNGILFFMLFIVYILLDLKACRVYIKLNSKLTVLLLFTILSPLATFLNSLRRDKGTI